MAVGSGQPEYIEEGMAYGLGTMDEGSGSLSECLAADGGCPEEDCGSSIKAGGSGPLAYTEEVEACGFPTGVTGSGSPPGCLMANGG